LALEPVGRAQNTISETNNRVRIMIYPVEAG